MGAAPIGVALAGPIDTSWIATGSALDATKLTGDLNGLQSQITGDGGVQAQITALQGQPAIDDETPSAYVRIGATQICWGATVTASTGYAVVTFPKPFADKNYVVSATAGNAGVAGGFAQVEPIQSTSSMSLQFNTGGTAAANPISWMAVGRWQ